MKNRIKFCKFVKVASKVLIGILIALAVLVVAALIFRACTPAENNVAYASEADGIGTWVWNDNLGEIAVSSMNSYDFDFMSNGISYSHFEFLPAPGGVAIRYDSTDVYLRDAFDDSGWIEGGENSPYRTMDIKTAPPAEFVTILRANATYQGGGTPTTYTVTKQASNCTISGADTIEQNATATYSITANAGYNLPFSVEVTNATQNYNAETGFLEISNATGNVTITANATLAPQPGGDLKPGKLNTMQQIIVQPNTTDIWQEYTFDMHTFNGADVWTDGKNIYLSLGTANQFIYNEVTRQWQTHTWSGSGWNLVGRHIWSDGSGEYLYYNNGTTAYRYTIATETWELVSNWSVSYDNQDRLYGQYFFSDGNGIYYWEPNKQICSVNMSTRSVDVTNWVRFGDYGAGYMWSDGINLYYNTITDIAGNPGESLQWVAGENFDAFKRITWTMDGRTIEFSGLNVANIAGKMYVFLNGSIYQINPANNTLNATPAFEPNAALSKITAENSGNLLSYYIWSDGTRVYYSHYPIGLQTPEQLDPENWYTQLELMPYETDTTQVFLQYITADNSFANARTNFDGVNLTWGEIAIKINTITHSNLFTLDAWFIKTENGYTAPTSTTAITNGMTIVARYRIYADKAYEFGQIFSSNSFDAGYTEGERAGIEIGKIQANDIVVENNASWRAGYDKGLADGNDNSLLDSPKAIFASVIEILDIPLFGIDGFTVGAIVAIAVTLGVLLFILRIIRG